ncbi:hypothetical protein QBC35DRAFT_457703 [Podospora australis]|uniref:Uncharacterized protein n=1 Tax=Podospora australis TaxID=1536484 RepID=A0AAN6WHU1_9PEZI|nr:hypothetical protein QBC35DRAFT_457703 [Podospora australis]
MDSHNPSDSEDDGGAKVGTEEPKPTLETLPAELRDQLLLHIPDLPTLRSAIHASPVLHAQYYSNRNTLLRSCLDRELHGFLVDAYACVMSRAGVLGSPRTDEIITTFLDNYRGWLDGSIPCPDLDSTDPGYVRWMAAFHLSVARPLARLFSEWALTNLQEAVTTNSVVPPADQTEDIQLSTSEEIRIFRALYRFQTFQHLFGRNNSRRQGMFLKAEINEIFFCHFDPWEVEAIACIYEFVEQKYEDIFARVRGDLHPTNERFRLPNGVFNPEGSVDLDLEHDDYMDGTISRGLKITARLLTIDPADHNTLVTKMQRCLTHHPNTDEPMKKALWTVAQFSRRESSTHPTPNPRDEAQDQREPMDFLGDVVPPDGKPPLGWVLLWGGVYSNIYGEYTPPSLKRWGYVMWDEKRWISWGPDAKELVHHQWNAFPERVDEIYNDFDWIPAGLPQRATPEV